MSEQDKQEASTHAKRAATQGRQAARNVGKAASAAASAGADKLQDVAEDVIDDVERVSGDVVDAPKRFLSPKGVAALTGDTGVGFLALSVAIYSATIAVNRFSAVYKGRKVAVNPEAFTSGRKVG